MLHAIIVILGTMSFWILVGYVVHAIAILATALVMFRIILPTIELFVGPTNKRFFLILTLMLPIIVVTVMAYIYVGWFEALMMLSGAFLALYTFEGK